MEDHVFDTSDGKLPREQKSQIDEKGEETTSSEELGLPSLPLTVIEGKQSDRDRQVAVRDERGMGNQICLLSEVIDAVKSPLGKRPWRTEEPEESGSNLITKLDLSNNSGKFDA